MKQERTYVRRLTRRINGSCRLEVREERKVRYRQARNRYFSEVKRCKRESWIKFITEEGKKYPWGLPYKVVLGKMKKESLICTMKFNGSYERDSGKLAWKFLDVLLPSDSLEYSEEQRMVIKQRLNVGLKGTVGAYARKNLKLLYSLWARRKHLGMIR